VTAKTIHAKAKKKYLRQVKPYVDGGSPFGHVIHGYCVAFGSKPETPGAFLSLAETRVAKPKKKSPPPNISPAYEGTVPARIALEAHRSNFLLMGTRQVVEWIDWVIAPAEIPEADNLVLFIRFPYAGRWYLGNVPSWHFPPPPWWREEFLDVPGQMRPAAWYALDRELLDGAIGWFVMEETACVRFLNSLSGIIRSGGEARPERLELPTFDPVGFGPREQADLRFARDRADYNYTLFRDGLALVTNPFRSSKQTIRVWSPKGGFEE
jgi:hypothetical protein